MDQLPHIFLSDTIRLFATVIGNAVYADAIEDVRISQNVLDAIEERWQEFMKFLNMHSDLQYIPAADIQRMLYEIQILQRRLNQADAFIAQGQLRIRNYLSALRCALEALAVHPDQVDFLLSSAVGFFDSLLHECDRCGLSSRNYNQQLEALHSHLPSGGIESKDIDSQDSEH